MQENADNSDDTMLSAYLDGELSMEEQERLVARLAREPALASRLDALRAADDRARQIFHTVDDVPMPAGILELLGKAEGASANDESSSQVISFPARGLKPFLQLPVALAAGLALAVGFVVGQLSDARRGTAEGLDNVLAAGITAGTPLQELLEHAAGPSEVSLGDDLSGRLLLTFQDGAGDYCRHASITSKDGTMQALACRRAGQWQAEVISYEQPGQSAGEYQVASSAAAPAVLEAVSRLIGDRPPLDADAEARLVANDWQTGH